MLFSDIVLSFFVLCTTGLWTMLAIPVVTKLFGKQLPDGGWGLTTVIGWLMLAAPLWFIGHLGMPVVSRTGVYIVYMLVVCIEFLFLKNERAVIRRVISQKKRYIVVQEVLFAVGFLTMTIIRGYKPDILDLEKFMDAGFMMVYLSHHTLPAPDMWLSGYTINYYTFGHFLGAIATHFWGQPLAISYNLLLGLLCGLTLKGAASAIINLSELTFKPTKKRYVYTVAVLGSLLTVFGGNSHIAWHKLRNLYFSFSRPDTDPISYWYPDATRFVHNTIHEFPAYSFIVSDLHAHVFSMPLVLAAFTIALVWFSTLKPVKSLTAVWEQHRKTIVYSLLLGSTLGLIASTSTWDTLIAGIWLSIMGFLLLLVNKKYWTSLLVSAVLIGLSTFITAAPWWLNFESISDGVCLVQTQTPAWINAFDEVTGKSVCTTAQTTPVWQLGVLWGGHLLVVGVAALAAYALFTQGMTYHTFLSNIMHAIKGTLSQHKKISLFILSACILSVTLIILPELFYIKDIYPDHQRANTMFKLTFHSFIVMSVIAGWLAAYGLHTLSRRSVLAMAAVGVTATLFVAASLYPIPGFKTYYGLSEDFREYKGLDGLQWLATSQPDDYAAIVWLQQQRYTESAVLLEAVGESYTQHARVSAFTGIPTVLGWRVHEWLWRGSFDIPGERTPEVQSVYTTPLSPEATTVLNKYGVTYIFVGSMERQAYSSLNETGLRQLGTVVFESGDTFVVAVK